MKSGKPPHGELWVSDAGAVYHKEIGVLCYAERHYDGSIFYPIKFKDRAAAQKWIVDGTIAEIQEGLSILAVGFSRECWRASSAP